MKQSFFVLVFFVFIILTVGTLYATNNVEEVGDWWGTVIINGVSGNNGAVIDAYIDGNKVTSATVGEYEIDYYLIHVEGQEGDEVLFKVNGAEAKRVDWSNGDHELDLEVIIQENPSTNSGGSGSSGGSSSDGSSENSPPTEMSDNTINLNIEKESESVNLTSNGNQKGITGAVIGFLGSGTGGTIFVIVLVLVGVGVVILIKNSKPLKKWIKKS